MDSVVTDIRYGGLTFSLGKLRQIDVKKFGQVGHPLPKNEQTKTSKQQKKPTTHQPQS